MNKLIIVFASLILGIVSCDKNEKKVVQPEHKIVSVFFKDYESNPEKAIENIFKSSKWLELNKTQSDTVFFKLKNIVDQLGKYRGYETIKSINVGKSYKIISTIAKYDRQPIRFNFILYKPVELWQVQNFNYDLNIESELEQNITLSFDY